MEETKKPLTLVADYQLSDSESEDESNITGFCLVPKEDPRPKLPPPRFDEKVSSSLFVNPYREAEIAKLAPLQYHVYMSPLVKDKKLMLCRKYEQTGQCPLGGSCQYEHLPGPTVEPPARKKRQRRKANRKRRQALFNLRTK
nr:uncharacterized protein LOC106692266 [Halyomorpha halys]